MDKDKDILASEERRQFLISLGKWSQVVVASVVGGSAFSPSALAVNWNDCRSNDTWLNSSGNAGHWINNANNQDTDLQGGGSQPHGDPNWMNGRRDGWTNRQNCRGGTWVNY